MFPFARDEKEFLDFDPCDIKSVLLLSMLLKEVNAVMFPFAGDEKRFLLLDPYDGIVGNHYLETESIFSPLRPSPNEEEIYSQVSGITTSICLGSSRSSQLRMPITGPVPDN